MLGFIVKMGYDAHNCRNGIEASPEAEAAYLRLCEENQALAKVEEDERKRAYAEGAARIALLPQRPLPFMKAGRLRESTMRGSVVHAVISNGHDGGYADSAYPKAALCGDAPKIMWTSAEGREVSCKGCLKLLALMQ